MTENGLKDYNLVIKIRVHVYIVKEGSYKECFVKFDICYSTYE